MDETTWKYAAFDEPQGELCPDLVRVWIGAMQGDEELDRKSILVQPVHTWFTTGANQDFQKDYDYIRWKYAAVHATTGGAFSGPPNISPNALVPCGPLGTLVSACTHLDDSVDFGTSAFTGSENAAASIIGHELVHTVGIIPQSECTAYTWELDHQNQTGIPCDGTYLQDVLLKKIAACGE